MCFMSSPSAPTPPAAVKPPPVPEKPQGQAARDAETQRAKARRGFAGTLLTRPSGLSEKASVGNAPKLLLGQ